MSLVPNTYNGLVSAVKALAEDDSAEFEAYIPTAIFIAEERLVRELDTFGLIAEVSVTASAGDPLLAKPSGHLFTHDIRFNTSGNSFIQPTLKTNDFIRDYWPTARTSTSTYPFGQPKYYGPDDNTNWVIAPTPASAYVFTVKYTKQLTHVSATNQTNYYTDSAPEALFYATMVHIGEFMKDYEVVNVWEGQYRRSIQGINNQGRRDRRDDGVNPRNPEGGPNTLRGDN